MNLFFLILLVTVFVVACPPIFNDFTFLGNESHTTADLVRDVFNKQPQLSWSEIVTKTGKPLAPWPGGKISYCYDQPSTRQHLENDMQEAWDLWYGALGPPGEVNGHKLQFYEYIFWPNEWQYCYLERHHGDDPWIWNEKVPYSVATILESVVRVEGLNPSAVVGYIPHDWPRGNEHGRMGIRLNLGQAGDYGNHENWIGALAHEMGHVFGLWHEHQRYDRDHYVRFNCAALPGYDKAKEQVEREGSHTMERVCASGALAATYSFSAVNDFDKIDHLDPASENVGTEWYWRQNFPDRDYDEQSIMHYDSGAHYWRDDDEKLRVRLAFWYHRGPDSTPPSQFTKDDLEYVYTNLKPSEKDVEGIKKLYAWSNPN